VKDWKNIYQAYSPWKQAGIAILVWDKVDFKVTLVKQDKEDHFILIKGAMPQQKITSPKRKVYNMSTYIKRTERAQINERDNKLMK
jgi:hypothetical protein